MKRTTYKFLMIFGLIAVFLNMIFAIIMKNHYATIGWMVALCWFPYDKIFANVGKGEQ